MEVQLKRTTVLVCVFILAWTMSASLQLSAQSTDRFDIGAQYTYFRNQHGYFLNNSLLGGRVDILIVRHVWLTGQLDSGLTFHPHPIVSSIDGGRILLGRFGTKIGKSGTRFGGFAEIRAGFVSWSDALIFWNFDPVSGGIRFGRYTAPLLNLAGTMEVHTTRKTGLRFTIGNSMVFHGKRQVVSIEPAFPGFIAHNVDISAGVFGRFF
jgi:hypothetical protein